MVYLSDQQFTLLQWINNENRISFDKLDDNDITMLDFLDNEHLIEMIWEHDLAEYVLPFIPTEVVITEYGKSVLKEQQRINRGSQINEEQLHLAEKNAADAKRDATFAKVISLLSVVLAMAALFT